jgi:hypothetical protein
MVRLACTRYDRKGYRLDTLIAKHGAETTLPDLRFLNAQCERQGQLGTPLMSPMEGERLISNQERQFMGHTMGAKTWLTTAKFSLQYKSES